METIPSDSAPQARRTLDLFLSFSCTFGDVRAIYLFLPLHLVRCWQWSLVLKLLPIGPAECLILLGQRRKWQERHGLEEEGIAGTSEFSTILFAEIFRFPSVVWVPEEMDGAKAFLQISPKRAWNPNFKKVCWLNLPKERAGKMSTGGQMEAEFFKPETVQRQTSPEPSSEWTHACPGDGWPAVLVVVNQQQLSERDIRIAINNLKFLKSVNIAPSLILCLKFWG